MEGTSARPGEPWETSIPKIMVGVLDTIGIAFDSSIDNKEFIPPIWKTK